MAWAALVPTARASVPIWDPAVETWLSFARRNMASVTVDYTGLPVHELTPAQHQALTNYQAWGTYQTIQWEASGHRTNAADEAAPRAQVASRYSASAARADHDILIKMLRPAPRDMVVWTASGGVRYPDGWVSASLAREYSALISGQPGRVPARATVILKGDPVIIVNATNPPSPDFVFQHEVILPPGATRRHGLAPGLEELPPNARTQHLLDRGASRRTSLPMVPPEPGGACFPAGTLVATEIGARRIDQIRVGDRVWSYDEEAARTVLKPVARTFVHAPARLHRVAIRLGGRVSTIRATAEHPFYVPERGWVPAALLVRGMPVVTFSGAPATVVSQVPTLAFESVFNIEVEDTHTYFVGVGGNGVLVHNQCAPPESRWSRAWSAAGRLGRLNMGPAPAVFGGAAVGMIGYALGGEYGAMGAGFIYSTLLGKWMAGGAMSWRLVALQGGAGVLAGLVTDQVLKAAGVKNGFVRFVANIGVGSVVAGGFAGYVAVQQGATLGAAASAVGTAMLSTSLYGVLTAEGMYHAQQWGELLEANRLAMEGEPNMRQAMKDISFGGTWNSWNPLTWYAYGISTYASGDFSALKLLDPF